MESRYDELMTRLGTVEVQSDPSEYKKAAKALAELEPLVQKFREFKASSWTSPEPRNCSAAPTPTCASWPTRS